VLKITKKAIKSLGVRLLGEAKFERYRQYFSFLRALFERDLKARYRRSSLGHVWIVLQPLLMMAVWLVIRSFFGIPSDGTPYVVFIYSGMILWTYFSTIIVNCAPAIQANASIIKKIKVPREIFLLVSFAIVSIIVDFL
jgi:lipopolysaccharide transport system permease protein